MPVMAGDASDVAHAMRDDESNRAHEVILETRDGQRISPACPICDAKQWGEPTPEDEELRAGFQPILMADTANGHVGLPVRVRICGNCGYVWYHTGAHEVTGQ